MTPKLSQKEQMAYSTIARLEAERDQLQRDLTARDDQLAELTQEDEKREALALSALKLTKEKVSLATQNEFLHAELVKRDALLRELADAPPAAMEFKLQQKVKAALSVSAEPNQCDGCQAGIPLINGAHRMGKLGGYPDAMSCQAHKYASAEPSAPVERDERAAFRVWCQSIGYSLKPCDGGNGFKPGYGSELFSAWHARAALDRKA